MLIEEFRGGVDVEIGAGVGAADDHDGHADFGGLMDAVVVHGRLEEMGVLFEPGCWLSVCDGELWSR